MKLIKQINKHDRQDLKHFTSHIPSNFLSYNDI